MNALLILNIILAPKWVVITKIVLSLALSVGIFQRLCKEQHQISGLF